MNTWRLHGHNPRIIMDDADHTTVAAFLRQEDAARVLGLEAEVARLDDSRKVWEETAISLREARSEDAAEIARLRDAAREVVAAQTEDATNAAIFALGQLLAQTA